MKKFAIDLFQALIFAALMFAPFFIYFWRM